MKAVIRERRTSAFSESNGRADDTEPLAELSPPLEIEDTGVLYRLPDRPRERPVIIDNIADADASRPERVPLAPPSAAA